MTEPDHHPMTLREDLITILKTADPGPAELISQIDIEAFADVVLAANWGPRLGMHDTSDTDDE